MFPGRSARTLSMKLEKHGLRSGLVIYVIVTNGVSRQYS